MKKISILYCFLSAALFTVAQKQANTWYFGNRTGLDFNQSPPKALTNSNVSSLEGCTVISDNNGKVLFYTNGITVINRKHVQMLNGNDLMGDLSSTSNAVVVPLPSNDSIYYLFTVGAQNQNSKGFRYSIINIKKDGGYGEVIQKNILVEDEAYEKLAAVKHCNKKDVWITVRKWNTDEYHTYRLTGSGIDPSPVVSHTTFIPSNPIGAMKYSANGKKLVSVYSFETNMVELMDFDNTTGGLTNSVVFQPQAAPVIDELYIQAYGAEFSPNSNLLYISANTSDIEPCTLYQFDITSNVSSIILASKQVITKTPPWIAGNLQIGPDQKLYMSMFKDNSISVIENPDIPGTGCNFVYNKIFLGQNTGAPLQFGLPTFIQSYFNPDSNPYDFARSGNCTDRNVSFTISRINNIDSVKWDFGDGQKSQLLSPVNNYASPGFYTVTLIVYKVDCSGENDTTSHSIWIAGSNNFLGVDTGSCTLTSLQIGTDEVTGANYLWSNGSLSNKITIDTYGLYWLKIEQNGCSVTDTINVYAKPKPTVKITGKTVVCSDKPVILNTETIAANSYLWNTGETTSTITITKAGMYKVEVTGNSCIASDSIMITWGDCEAFVPTAFTPNNDGLNDRFGVASGFLATGFLMEIFDRWGNIIFQAADNTQKWDGLYKGKTMPSGAYSWIIRYKNKRGIKIDLQGTVLLIR